MQLGVERTKVLARALFDDLTHPNPEKYSSQRIFILEIDEYVYLVPYLLSCVENKNEIFLKTIIPSRKAERQKGNKAISWRAKMSKAKPNKGEKDLLKGFESGEFESQLTNKRKNFVKSVTEDTYKKDKRINIRISSCDLESIQSRALEEGIPYQTLVSSILHKFVSGSLKSTVANDQVKQEAS